jgi:ATP-dependent DNA helicase RecG
LFEKTLSNNQELTFEYLKKSAPFGDSLSDKFMSSLKIGGSYNNAALLLSDQCEHTLRFSVFDKNRQIVSMDTFSGSLLCQLQNALERIEQCLIYSASGGAKLALREAAINAVIHRDYSFSGSTLINIYSEKAEVVSPGGAVGSLSVSDLKLGISQPRNPILAAFFAQRGYVRLCGFGLSSLFYEFRSSRYPSSDSLIKISENVFSVTVPLLSQPAEEVSAKHKRSLSLKLPKRKKHISDLQQENILGYLATHVTISRPEVQVLLGIGQTRALNILKAMVKSGQIRANGYGKNTVYRLPM